MDGKYVTTPAGDRYHPGCFTCLECGSTLENGFVLTAEVRLSSPTRHLHGLACHCMSSSPYAYYAQGKPLCAQHAQLASAVDPEKARKTKAAAIAAAAASAADGRSERAAELAAEDAAGGDGFVIDMRTGERVYVESGTRRKYRWTACCPLRIMRVP